MRDNMYRYLYLTTVLCAISLTVGCDDPINPTAIAQSGVFYISNNSTVPLEFKIDNTHFLINYGEIKKIKLENGKHILVEANGKKNTFMIYPGNHGGIINPARDIYYSFTSVFASKENSQRFYLDKRPVWVDGRLVSGAINSSDALFIDNNVFRCDVPLNEPIPTYLPDWKNTGIGNVLTKCFSQDEFHEFLARYPYGIHFYSEHDLLKESESDQYSWINKENTRTNDFIPRLNNIDFNNEKLIEEAGAIYEIIDLYLASRDANERQGFYNEYHLHIMIMAMIYSQQIQNDIFDDKDAYFQFMQETGRIFGAGILSEPALI
ncbi:hypothetical protein [Proteus hauseri]|uniref:hypothetical protein n=1 Tax=Proteus hauseri TaxID=183417 RepID=UPI001FC97AD2|nr:hypothetical protein [Proteus hauseri]